jgi:hypothetical protein
MASKYREMKSCGVSAGKGAVGVGTDGKGVKVWATMVPMKLEYGFVWVAVPYEEDRTHAEKIRSTRRKEMERNLKRIMGNLL